MNFSCVEKYLKNRHHFLIYFLLAFIILFNFKGRYILTLDMIYPMNTFFTDFFYGFTPSAWGGFVPIAATMKLSSVIPAWTIQRFYLFLIIFLSGISMHSLVNVKSHVPKYYAGVLYAINPFVYSRFLAGQWFILLGYSIVPFAIKSFLQFLDDQKLKHLFKSVLFTTLVGAFSSHILVLLFMVYFVLLIIKLYSVRSETDTIIKLMKSLGLFAILFISLNLYWLLPLFTAKSTLIHQISMIDVYAFSTKTSSFNSIFTIATMHGFWRGGYLYTKDIISYWYFFFVFILFIAVHGFINNYRDKNLNLPVTALGIVAIIAVILGSGIHGPFSSLFEYLFNNIFFFRGFRDSHKFAALLALSYSYLGALGVWKFEKMARCKERSVRLARFVAFFVIFLALITPFIYSITMFNGFWGQLNPTDYPDDWYEMNDFLNNDPQDFNVLFLPWHQYMDFGWIPNAQKRIGNPASSFFDKPIIQGENTEIGSIYSQSTNPAQNYVETLLNARNNITNFGKQMVVLNVKYIMLTKESDYEDYFFLFNQSDVKLIKETENFYVFENNNQVSRFYRSSSLLSSDQSLLPIDYVRISPVKFSIKTDNDNIVFVPPNLDSMYWELDGQPSREKGVNGIYPGQNGTIYYSRFNIYLGGYVVSLFTLLSILFWYRTK